MIRKIIKRTGLDWMLRLNPQDVRADVFAGAAGAAVVLPQAVAFAAIAGLPPEYGVYTAIVTPIIAALFGSSLIMVSGPTTAISALVFSALAGIAPVASPQFIQNAITLAFLVGLIQLVFAFIRIGRIAGFVSHSVMLGFTAAAAVHIAFSQIAPAMGIDVSADGVIARAAALAAGWRSANLIAIASAITTIVAVVLIRRFLPRWPAFLLALMLGSTVPYLLNGATTGLRFVGTIPAALPTFSLPDLGIFPDVRLLESAFVIALVGLLEAIAIGRTLSYKTGSDFSSNRETFGQGLSNVVGGLFQCYPASGSFTRSALNLESGAKSPLAAIFAALFLALLAVLFRPLVAQIPMSAIAGLILYVAWRLMDFNEIIKLFGTSRVETGIVAVTFFAGVLGNLEFAIYLGALMSLGIFLRSSSQPALVIGAPRDSSGQRSFANASLFNLPECPRIIVIRFDGPIFFGSVDFITQEFRRFVRQRPEQKNAILILKGVGDVDHAGAEALMQEVTRRRSMGGDVFLVASYPPLIEQLNKTGLIAQLGADHLFPSKRLAIARAVQQVPEEICEGCAQRVFLECADKGGAGSKLVPASACQQIIH
jgi:SulP family sulfate permease